MNFTSTTELARQGSKAFQNINYAIVMHNNKDIGMVIGGELYKKLQESRILEDMLEDIEMDANREVLSQRWQESLSSGVSNLVI